MPEWTAVGVLVIAFLASAARVGYLALRRERAGAAIEDTLLFPDEERDSTLTRYLQILGVRLEPVVFAAGLCLVAVTVSLIFLTLFEDELEFSIAAGVTFFPLAFFVLKDLVERRAQEFEWALVDSLDLAASLTASGVAALKAIEAAVKGGSPVVRTELLNLVRRLQLGDSIEGATARLLDRYRSEGVGLFVNLLRSRWHAGADFDALLKALVRVLRERRTFLIQSRGQLSGAKYALLFAAVFPYLLIPFFQHQEPDWLAPITNHPAGPAMLYMAILLQVIGLLWARAILRGRSW